MSRLAAFFIGLAGGAIFAATSSTFEWRQVTETQSGVVWSWRSGTLGSALVNGKPAVAVTLQRKQGKIEQVFAGAVVTEHCNKERGDFALLNYNTGAPVEVTVFVKGSSAVEAVLAQHICAAHAQRGKS